MQKGVRQQRLLNRVSDSSSVFSRMRQRGTTLLLAIMGTLGGATLLLLVFLTGSARHADAKTHTLSGAHAAVLDDGEDSGNDWTQDQERLISTVAAKLACRQLELPNPRRVEKSGQNDDPLTPFRRPRKIPAADDPSPH